MTKEYDNAVRAIDYAGKKLGTSLADDAVLLAMDALLEYMNSVNEQLEARIKNLESNPLTNRISKMGW